MRLPCSHGDDGRGRSRRAVLLQLPESTQGEEPLNQHAGAPEQRSEAACRCGGIFPSEESIMRLPGAVLTEQNEEWLLQNRYLPQYTMAEIDQAAENDVTERCHSAHNRPITGPEGRN